jgi:DNA polymerase-3 subunit delta'
MSLMQEKLCPWLTLPLQQLEQVDRANRRGHAWMICGPQGVGKLNLALCFVQGLLDGKSRAAGLGVLGPDEFANCMLARYLPTDHHPDLHLIHPEEGKRVIAVEQIRQVTESLHLTAHAGGAKAVVIEPAEQMTTAAANALLKSLEEPAPATYLVLVSHRLGRLPATIRSRCQKLIVRGPAEPALRSWAGQVKDRHLADANPFRLAQRIDKDNNIIFNELESNINQLSQNRGDPIALVGQWDKDRLDEVLDWLILVVQGALRRQLGGGVWNGVTDAAAPLSQNLARVLSARSLFRQLERAQALRNQLGSGLNETLAMQVLMVGFLPADNALNDAKG